MYIVTLVKLIFRVNWSRLQWWLNGNALSAHQWLWVILPFLTKTF